MEAVRLRLLVAYQEERLVLRRAVVYSTSSAMSAGEGGSSERRGRPTVLGVRVVRALLVEVRLVGVLVVSCWEGEAM